MSFFHIHSTKHFNLSNMTMTVGHQRYQLYTDSTGVLREIRNGEGHPFISEDIAIALRGFPVSEGWVISPVEANEAEPPEEVIPVELSEDGRITQASGTLAARLKETLLQVKHRDTLLKVLEDHVREQSEENARLLTHIEMLERELHNMPRTSEPVMIEEEDEQVPAPMIKKNGNLGRPRKNPVIELHANDASVSSALAVNEITAQVPTANMADLDDIPRK